MKRIAFALLLIGLTAVVARAGGYGAQVVTSNVLMAPAPAQCYTGAATLQIYARQVQAVPLTIVPTVAALPAPTIVQQAPMIYQAPAVVQQQVVQTYAAPAAVQVNAVHGYGYNVGAAGFRALNVNVVHNRGFGFNRNVVVNRQVNVGVGLGLGVNRQVVRQRTVVRGGLFGGRSVQRTVIRSR